MQIRCPECQKVLAVKPQPNAFRVKCPGCQTILNVPGSTASADNSVGQAPGQPAPPPPPPSSPGPFDSDPFGDLPSSPSGAEGAFPSSPSLPPQSFSAAASAPAPRETNAAALRGKKKFPVWGWVLVGAVLLLAAPVMCCGVVGLIGMSQMKGEPSVVMTEGLESVPLPGTFPDLGPAIETVGSGVTIHRVVLRGNGPGASMEMRVYMPPGDHNPGTLPCVFVAPAGTPLLHGVGVDDGDYHDETLPYAEAGMVVVHYSIDGAIPPGVDQTNEQAYANALKIQWPPFKDSGGGIVNGRNAIDFALAKIPAVNAKKLCVAGHSSAGTLALILAASDPRVTHCAAYAPAYDCEKRMAEAIADPMLRILLPGLADFIAWYSPMNHTEDYHCPLLVFHARDDDNVPMADAQRFVSALKGKQKTVQFVTANSGGHYESMIREGVPAAIRWLNAQ